MALLAIIAVVAVPFLIFWWSGRGVRRNPFPTPENRDAWAGGDHDPVNHHGPH